MEYNTNILVGIAVFFGMIFLILSCFVCTICISPIYPIPVPVPVYIAGQPPSFSENYPQIHGEAGVPPV